MSETKFPIHSTYKQTEKLNSLLHLKKRDYTLADIFDLPHDIKWNGKRGYLEVGAVGISYTSTADVSNLQVVYYSSLQTKCDIFECFIEIVEFFIQYFDSIEYPTGSALDTIFEKYAVERATKKM